MIVEIDKMEKITAAGQYVESATSAETTTSYPITEALWCGSTEFGTIDIVESVQYGRMLFLDGELQSTESDEAIYHEMLVHPAVISALAKTEKPMRVLILGGGEGATAREVLKYTSHQVSEVVWIDIDPDLVKMCRMHLVYAEDDVYNDKRLFYFPFDAKQILEDHDMPLFDVIIVDLPDPNPNAEEYLYSTQFWTQVRSHLTSDGCVVTHAGPCAPGKGRQELLDYICKKTTEGGFDELNSTKAHIIIPSFQGEWAYWYSSATSVIANLYLAPDNLKVVDSNVLGAALTWPLYWQRPIAL